MLRAVSISFLLIFSSADLIFSQSTQPTSTGLNSIEFNSSTSEYFFKVNGQTLYKYWINDGPFCYQTGGTLFGLKSVTTNGHDFWPSYVGGIQAIFEGIIANTDDNKHVRYQRLDHSFDGETVTTRWRMLYYINEVTLPVPLTFPTDTIDYTYRIRISGKTLIIQVEVDNNSTDAIAFQFGRCESDLGLESRIVTVPSLTLTSLL
jgi:hypothetical protein